MFFTELILLTLDLIYPWVISVLINWLQTRQPDEPFEDTMRMIAFGMTFPLVKGAQILLNSFATYDFGFQGHFMHNSLKIILLHKSFRMSAAADQYTSNDISNMVIRRSGVLGTSVYFIPLLIRTPIKLAISCIIVFQEIGWSALTVVVFMGLRT